MTLLSELHKKEYERIIVVGHSLGSILAYDLISYFWAEHQAARIVTTGSDEFRALLDIEAALQQIETALREMKPRAPIPRGSCAGGCSFPYRADEIRPSAADPQRRREALADHRLCHARVAIDPRRVSDGLQQPGSQEASK